MRLDSTVDNKRFFTKPNGDIVVDLSQQRYIPGKDGSIIDVMIVTKDFAMRPDLLSKLGYRDINGSDLVMKQNGISNPFAIDVDDLIFLQERRAISSQFADGKAKAARDVVRNQYLDSSKSPEIDDNLKLFESREKPKKGKRKAEPALPPNFANFGDKEIKLRGGKVIFGEDVTANKEVCDEKPLAKSEFLKRLAKNRLNNQ